jgi:CRISPR-associated protein Csd1
MSWIEQLCLTYESCYGKEEDSALTDGGSLKKPQKPLLPPFHTLQNSHVEIRIDGNGNFIDAKLLEDKNDREIIIPCTEKSSSRTSGEEPHPLCDKIQYCAKDYVGTKRSYFNSYEMQLQKWSSSYYTHPMVDAILNYVNKGTLVEDLIKAAKDKIKKDEDPGDLFVRWKVEIPGEKETRCWKSHSLFESWKLYAEHQETVENICMVTGEMKPIALNHPKRIRSSGDGAKLISSNDRTGYTYLGRFLLTELILNGKEELIAVQSASISMEVSQKAHSALRWLIDRQGFRNGDQVIISWAVCGKEIPNPLTDSLSIFDETDEEKLLELTHASIGDAGQTFARRLNKKIAGYQAEIGENTNIVVLGLDSAGPGRLSMTFYRELLVSGYFERIQNWHEQMAWHFHEFLDAKNEKQKRKIHGYRVYAPAPRTIAESCYGKRLDDKLKKATVERLLPCIIDGKQIPDDLVNSAVKRASNKVGMENWEWERTLSVACALFRSHANRNSKNLQQNNKYTMALENERTDRDYLYGRLLAVAEHIEEAALRAAHEKRETSAARLMQRFADYPFSTWRSMESALVPYKSRLHVNRPGILYKMKNLLDEIHANFQPGDFEKDVRLSGAYLLGYHCQRLDLMYKAPKDETEADSEADNNN